MKILITGATGFVGGALVRYFSQLNHTVIASGRRPAPLPQMEPFISGYYPLDLLEPIPEKLPFFDLIIHAAVSYEDGQLPQQAAYKGATYPNEWSTRQLLEQASCRTFVFISSASVYLGQGTPLVEDETHLDGNSDYGKSKILSERALYEVVQQKKDTRVIVFRPRAIYGIGDRTILPRMAKLRKGNRILFNPGFDNAISMTHIENLAQAIHLGIQLPSSAPFSVYNIADDRQYRTKAVTRLFLNSLYQQEHTFLHLPKRIFKPFMEPLTYHYIQQSVTLDIGKAKRELGYLPTFKLEDAISSITHWAREKKVVENFNNPADLAWAI